MYEIRDPIYGFIKINDLEREIIDSPVFQRLRRIKQLSLTNFVYPGANHTRFEHSLGVMHLATLMFDAIVEQENNRRLLKDYLGIEYDQTGIRRDRQIIRLAALLHDIGHGPFSHSGEELFPEKGDSNRYQHEEYSIAIIREYIRPILEENRINRNNFNITVDEVVALIGSDPRPLGSRIFWKVLISSQLDSDRGDYLLRDSYYTGVRYGIYDYHRLIDSITLAINPDSEELDIAIKKSGWHVAESLILSRYLMYTQVYFHKTRRAYNYHIKNALKFVLKEETGIETFPEPKNKEKLEEFLIWDDYHAWVMFEKYKESNEDCMAIVKRNHIRQVYSTRETPSDREAEIIEKIINQFEKEGIWYYKDDTSREWYKTGSDEILIVDKENKVRPLSEYSPVVRDLKGINKTSLYVKPQDRKKAIELIRNLLN